MATDFLLLIGDHEPLVWVLTNERMAFPAARAYLVSQLSPDDRLFLYSTRGCFHNPTRDRGRVIGEATVRSTVATLEEPVKFGDKAYPLGCRLKIIGLAARGEGIELGTMTDRLNLFPDSRTWSARLRPVLVAIDRHDAALIHEQLIHVMHRPEVHRAGYLRRTPPPRKHTTSRPEPISDRLEIRALRRGAMY